MKAIILSLSVLLLAGAAIAQDKEKDGETIQGNGTITTREVNVTSFDALKATGVYELKLSQGDKESVKIEADENLQPLFLVHNEGNQLVVEMKEMEHTNIRSTQKIRVYVTFKKLKSLDLSTVGNVSSDEQLAFDNLDLRNKSVGNVDLRFTANTLDLKNHSVGNMKLSGKAGNALVKNNGVGALQAGSFVVQTMDIENTGVGAAEVNAEKDLKVMDSFLGQVKNKGAAPMRKLKRVRA